MSIQVKPNQHRMVYVIRFPKLTRRQWKEQENRRVKPAPNCSPGGRTAAKHDVALYKSRQKCFVAHVQTLVPQTKQEYIAETVQRLKDFGFFHLARAFEKGRVDVKQRPDLVEMGAWWEDIIDSCEADKEKAQLV